MIKPAFDPLSIYQKAQQQSAILAHVMIVLMMALLAASFALFGARLIPKWNGTFLVILCLIISIEAIYNRKRTDDMELRERLIFRASEAVAFAIIAKILLYIVHNPAQILKDIPLWQQNFLESFFTAEYLLVLVIMLAVWLISLAYAGELEDLYNRENDAVWDELGKLQNVLHEIRSRIAARLFLIGAAVVVFSVLSRLDTSVVLRQHQGGLAMIAPILIVVGYFLLALVMLSTTQFALLRTRWLWQRLPISPKVAANWLKFGLLAFIVLAVIVMFLPTHYSIGLIDTLRLAFEYLLRAFSFLVFLITLPFTICLSILSLFRGNAQEEPQQPMASPQVPPITQPGEPLAWIEFLRSLLFWALFLAVIFFALRYYLQQNAALWNAITRFPLIRWIAGAFRGLWMLLRGANREVASLVKKGILRLRAQRVTAPAQAIRRLRSLARMNPRERIIYFYLSLVQLGGERGIDRSPAQTPYHYEQRLGSAIPEIDSELHNLTETFLEARYSQHPVEQPQSDQASSLWERIKAVLKDWKREE